MIIMRLMGGLGNQLFQYSLGRKLSLLNNKELLLDDVNGFKGDLYRREFMLDKFNIKAKLVSKTVSVKKYIPSKTKLIIEKTLRDKYSISVFPRIVWESNSDYSSEIIKKYEIAYFIGYWQSDKYFNDIQNILRSDFKIITPKTDNNFDLLKEIQNTNSVAIHFRRYGMNKSFDNESALQYHGEIEMDYYNNAIEYFSSILSEPRYYIFSDDVGWAKEKIRLKQNISFIDNKELLDGDIEDFRLMMNCKHFIIANSTFSWWAAWLSNHNDKKVVAPKNWFAKKDLNTMDIYNAAWKII